MLVMTPLQRGIFPALSIALFFLFETVLTTALLLCECIEQKQFQSQADGAALYCPRQCQNTEIITS